MKKMTMKNNKMLQSSIAREREGKEYQCPIEDRALLQQMFQEINKATRSNVHYLAEMDAYNIRGAGEIVAKYISGFSSESVRGFLIPQMVADKIEDCDRLMLQMYRHFEASEEYIAKPGNPAPAHIYVRYDNEFKALKPKRLKMDLLALMRNPRNAVYLPLTVNMLASWRMPELLDVLITYSEEDRFTADNFGLCDTRDVCYYPPLDAMNRELKFIAINGLKYYQAQEAKAIVETFIKSDDKDIQDAAKKAYKAMEK